MREGRDGGKEIEFCLDGLTRKVRILHEKGMDDI